MADSFDFKLEGVESLLGKFEAISYDLKRKGGRSALRKAANVVANKAKQNAARIDDPATAASIPSNIAVRWNGIRFKYTGDLGFRIGILGKAGVRPGRVDTSGLPGGDTRHWYYVEFGARHMAAKPFMRPALADNISEVTSTFISAYEKAIDSAIKRAKKKAAKP